MSFVTSFLLPYLVPVLVQGLTPIIVEYTKIAVGYVKGHLPASVVTVLAATIAEGVNQASAALAGASLPPGVGAVVAIFINELGADFGMQPPTPGLK
jgi:hypothetical protein